MDDWTDNASQELKEIIDDAMEMGMHEDFDNFYDFLRMCADHYEERREWGGTFEPGLPASASTQAESIGNTEPPCYCEHPAQHDNWCAYKIWKNSR